MGRVVLHLPGGESEKPYVVGTYVGDGTAERLIPLGFEPSAVALWRDDGTQMREFSYTYQFCGGLAIKGKPCRATFPNNFHPNIFAITSNGFVVYRLSDGSYCVEPNNPPYSYHYIAFR